MKPPHAGKKVRVTGQHFDGSTYLLAEGYIAMGDTAKHPFQKDIQKCLKLIITKDLEQALFDPPARTCHLLVTDRIEVIG